MPRGYPRQEVPIGSGDVSGMCLTTDIRTSAYQARIDRSVQECSHSQRQLDRVQLTELSSISPVCWRMFDFPKIAGTVKLHSQ